MKVRRTIFLAQSLPTLRILHTKFGLIWRPSWPEKKDLFLKFFFGEIQKVPYEILTFFLGKLHQKFFLFYILITLVILPAEFGLICDWFAEIGLHAEIPFRDWFAKNSFCFTLSLHWWLSIPSVVHFEQLLDPIKFLYFWK